MSDGSLLHFLAKDDERFGKVPSLALVTPAAVSAEMFQKNGGSLCFSFNPNRGTKS